MRLSSEASRERTETLIISAVVKFCHPIFRRERRRISKAPVTSSFSRRSVIIFISAEVAVSSPPKRVVKSSLNIGQGISSPTSICVSQCAAESSRTWLKAENNALPYKGFSSIIRLTAMHHVAGWEPAVSGLERGSDKFLSYAHALLLHCYNQHWYHYWYRVLIKVRAV